MIDLDLRYINWDVWNSLLITRLFFFFKEIEDVWGKLGCKRAAIDSVGTRGSLRRRGIEDISKVQLESISLSLREREKIP